MDYGPGEGPEIFAPSQNLELISLSGRFSFHHHDLCRFHLAIVMQTRERLKDLERFIDENRHIISADVDFESYEAVLQSRVRDYAHSWEIEIENVQGHGDHLFVVGLWAMTEQYCTRILEIAQRGRGSSGKLPFVWPKVQHMFATFGVEVKQCKGFADANECRVLNNKVKHLGTVDEELARFPAFHGLQGEPLDRVAIDLQRYSNAIFEFVGGVMEAADS